MCVNPGRLPDATEIACRKCWQCRENRVNDWVGRCIAESKTSVACHAITLTYGRDQYGAVEHPSALVLTYSDVQKYFKLLRRHGFPLRYLAVGEYGTMKGRAHWHLMVYWQDKVPEHELDVRFEEKHWPHGFSHWTKPSYQAVRYNVKYIQKDIGEMERQGHLSMSKKPPLGAAYFRQLAGEYVKQGLSPRDCKYSFPDMLNSRGNKHEFLLSGKSVDLFLAEFVASWMAQRPGQPWPRSELVDQFVDPERTEQQIAEALADRKFDQKFAERLHQIELARNAAFIGGIWNGPAYRYLRAENGA